MQILAFGGWPVDCVNEFLGVLRRDRLKPLGGLGQIRRRQSCDLDCTSIGAWKGGRRRDGGAFGLDFRGWSASSSALTVAGFGPALRRMLTTNRDACATCLHANGPLCHPAFPLNPMGSQLRQPRAGAVDTRPVDAGAGFRAVFEETVCQGNHAKTGGRLPMHVKRSYERPTRVYESLREFTQKKNCDNQ